MTKKQVLELNSSLKSLNNLTGVKFAYAIAKNISLLKPEVDALKKTLEPTEDFNKYDNERAELAKKHAKKDEKGKEMLKVNEGQSVYDIENMEAFEKAFEKLKKDHKKAIDAREKQIEDYNKLLDEEVKVELYKLNLEHVPEGISAKQMSAIIDLIEE